MANQNNTSLSSGTMLAIFVIIMIILFIFGDTFTFIVGLLIEGLVFSIGYNKVHISEH